MTPPLNCRQSVTEILLLVALHSTINCGAFALCEQSKLCWRVDIEAARCVQASSNFNALLCITVVSRRTIVRSIDPFICSMFGDCFWACWSSYSDYVQVGI